MNTNNTSTVTLTFNPDGVTGNYVCEADNINTLIQDIKVSSPQKLGSREITFIRVDKYRQMYSGLISSDGTLIAGFLINMNDYIPTNEKFPFYAKEVK
ncbi:MAG TPA: hypothetical protein VIH42_03470 [Thermoguttaceae bacterium]